MFYLPIIIHMLSVAFVSTQQFSYSLFLEEKNVSLIIHQIIGCIKYHPSDHPQI